MIERLAEALKPFLSDAYQQGYICGWDDKCLQDAAQDAATAVLRVMQEPSGGCPRCGYPDTNDGEHFKGIYVPGKPCVLCGYE